ncbi:flavin reductase family protein [Methylobacterium sp. BTF04]|uniref:flavin reductase family protein n=1 Tax=Methylobacterium sp. BTF04 TaxID=2708300 RepID=UPI0013D298F5|nr:flavin reductase family protein [Methylobacterium sp. BTF04]NEU11369.1 flavin reductase family protein [Methylobacterium sp. BTF04]
MHYDSETKGLPHNPLKALIAPRPIGWISAMNKAGAVNLAPYSYFNAVASGPDMVMFSSAGRKDAMTFAEEGGEFVCNIATFALRDAMNATSAPLERGESEFAFAGLTPVPSRKVRPPRVGESPAAIECKWVQTVPLTPLDGSEASHFLVIGQVVSIYIDDAYIKDGLVETSAMRPILRGGYFDYFTAEPETRFALKRPAGAGQ